VIERFRGTRLASRFKNKHHPPAVVIGLNAAALSIVRSLGRKGIRIIGLYENPKDYCTKSKYLSKKMYQTPLRDEPLVNRLTRDVVPMAGESAVLFCATDESVLTVSKYHDHLRPHFQFVLPDYEVTLTQISKKRFHEFALSNEFPVPKSFFTNGISDIKKIAEEISFPCIIKPEYKDSTWNNILPNQKVLYANSKESLLLQIEHHKIVDRPLFIQEWIPGEDTDLYFCLVYLDRQAEPLAVFTGKKLRQHPHLAGTLSVAESIWVPEIAEISTKLLKAAGCIGFCSVEFKHSKTDGRYYVIEPTVGRPDSQEGFCVSTGLDIPYIAYLEALGESLGSLGDFPEGMKWIDEELAYYTIQEYFRKTLTLNELISLFKGNRAYSLSALDDPLPALTFFSEKILSATAKLPKYHSGSSQVGFKRKRKTTEKPFI
jgi:predicted ATP-grasp superfamily ATP-dependent carboligase